MVRPSGSLLTSRSSEFNPSKLPRRVGVARPHPNSASHRRHDTHGRMSFFCFSWWCSPAPQEIDSPSRRPLLKVRWTNGGCNACAKRAGGSSPRDAKHAAGGGTSSSANGSRADDASSFRLNGGRYKLNGHLGRGAHCIVWRCQLSSALTPTEERPQSVALKVHIGGTDGGRQARREADALAALAHSGGLFPRLIGMVSFNGRQLGLGLGLGLGSNALALARTLTLALTLTR